MDKRPTYAHEAVMIRSVRPTPCLPVAATLTLKQAALTRWHCVVIGAGPSGAAVAIRLSQQGLRVLLVDREQMPRPKLCGCCLSVTAMTELLDLGIDLEMEKCLSSAASADAPHAVAPQATIPAIPLKAVRIVASGKAVRIPLPGGASVSREALDTTLVRQAIDCGAAWLPGLIITSANENPTPPYPMSQATRQPTGSMLLAARLVGSLESDQDPIATTVLLQSETVVIATGLSDCVRIEGESLAAKRSVVAHSRIGVGTTLPPESLDVSSGELIMAVTMLGYCGLVRLEDGRIDVAAAVDREFLRVSSGLADALGKLLLLSTIGRSLGRDGDRSLHAALCTATFRATPPLSHASALVAGSSGRIFRVGDAAGYVEPFTGEGMGWALGSARIFSDALVASCSRDASAHATNDWVVQPSDIAAAYSLAHKNLFGPHHQRCLRVSGALRFPILVAIAVQCARMAPWIAQRLLPMLIGAAAPLSRQGGSRMSARGRQQKVSHGAAERPHSPPRQLC